MHRTLEGRRLERRHLPGPSCFYPYLFQGDCYLRVTLCLTPGVSLHSTPGRRGRKSRKRKRTEIQPIIRRPDMAVVKPFQINILAPAFRLGNSFIIMLSQPSEDTLVETQFCRTHTGLIAQRSLSHGEKRSLYGSTCCGSFQNPTFCIKIFLLYQLFRQFTIASKGKPPP